MPRLDTARRAIVGQYNGAKTIGQIHKDTSDFLMEATWDNDIQSRVCYLYDYKHDDSPTLKDHIEYTKDTTKTKIDAKFIISSYGSIDKDQVAYHIMFKPSQKIDFEEGDELYYYETDYKRKYGSSHFIGLYIDIPDDEGIYYRWIICDYEEANQFVKYSVLPCDYRFEWVQIINGKKYIRRMWGCLRNLNSYTAGIFVDRYFTSLDNVNKFILPMNSVTEIFGYNDSLGDAQRLIISAKVPHPNAWQVSKIENTQPFGLLKVTVKQVPFNDDTDYIEYDELGSIVSMLADYYSADKAEPVVVDPEPYHPMTVLCEITSSSPTIKVNGSFRTLTAKFYLDGDDVSEEFKQFSHEWRFFLNEKDGERIDQIFEIKQTDDSNIIKIKCKNEKEYIGERVFIDLWTNTYYYGRLEVPLTIVG